MGVFVNFRLGIRIAIIFFLTVIIQAAILSVQYVSINGINQKTSELSEIQRYQLLQARKKRVIEAVGGVDSNYYKDTKARKVFSAFGRDFKKEFSIPRYDSLQKQYFEKAMEFTRN